MREDRVGVMSFRGRRLDQMENWISLETERGMVVTRSPFSEKWMAVVSCWKYRVERRFATNEPRDKWLTSPVLSEWSASRASDKSLFLYQNTLRRFESRGLRRPTNQAAIHRRPTLPHILRAMRGPLLLRPTRHLIQDTIHQEKLDHIS
jgi:hypothetical protein